MYKIISSQYNNNGLYIFFSFLIFLLIISPLLIFKYPILIDYPNHLASYFIQASIDNNPLLKENYSVEWHIKPYLIVEALGGMLARYLDIFVAGRVLVLLGIIFICLGAILIRKFVNRRVDLWILTVFALLFNNILFWGLVNYFVSSGIALIIMAAWIKFRNVAGLKNILFFSALSTFLFFSHLFALGVYGVFVISYEIGQYIYSRDSYVASDLAKAAAQFILPAILFFGWYSGLPHYHVDEFFVYGSWVDKVLALISPIYFDYSDYTKYSVPVFFMFVSITRIIFHCRIGFHDNMKLPLLVFLLMSIVTPVTFAGVYQVDIRLIFIFMLIFVSSVRFYEDDKNTKNFRICIILIAITMACFKAYFISSTWNGINRQYQEFENSLQYVRSGSKIITIQDEPKNIDNFDDHLYHHMSALSIIKRSTFWPNLFTVNLTPIYPSASTKKIDTPLSDQLNLSYLLNTQAKNGYVYSQSRVVYWADWKKDFDYLISIRFDNLSIINIKELKLKVRGSFFDIYEIIH
ncbi:hypothetical protein [Methylomicrobium lacus]|uniref:hypothetical protein n=1 Tax=Methylomicrobium lacus TaxID=136992 RepID=UPI00045EBDD5|nr:hypothetical protein [Methylomicrobium lacus]